MAAGKLNLTIEQGADWTHRLTWRNPDGTAIDLTGWDARLHAREYAHADATVLELAVGAGIELGGAAGTIDLSILAAASSAWTWRQAVYDLELVSPAGAVTRLVRGKIVVDPEVTR